MEVARASPLPRSPAAKLDLGKSVASAAVLATLVLGFADTTRAQVPTINVQETCRTAASAMVAMGTSTSQSALEQCLISEQRARDQIVKDWATFSAADKAQCLQTKLYLPSYVEWLTCLEMERDVRKQRASEPTSSPTAAVTLPRVRPGINDGRAIPATAIVTLPTVRPGINDGRTTGTPTAPITLPIVRPGTLY